MLAVWHANIDFQTVLSQHVVLNYISKYVVKNESKYESYHQMLAQLAQNSSPDAPTITVVHKLLTEFVANRDIGAQETCHMLQKLPLTQYNHSFVSLNVKRQVFRRVSQKLDGHLPTTPFITSYMQRPHSLESLSLIKVAWSWSFSSRWKTSPWKHIFPSMVVRVIPRYTSILAKDRECYVDFY